MIDRIKCPNCGSTAQVELVWVDRNRYEAKTTEEYECGCGCHFEVIFRATEINILPAVD